MKKFPLFSKFSLAFCLAVFLTNAYSDTPLVPQSELIPAKKHTNATEVITYIINSHHYRKKPIDNTLSSSMFDAYLKNLDPNHSFFLNEDIQNFSKYRYKLDEALEEADLEPAFDIFRIYRKRVKERINYAVSELKKEFDFEIDEDYLFDRRELNWANDVEELNDFWRKRVKNDMLNLLVNRQRKNRNKRHTKEEISANLYQHIPA